MKKLTIDIETRRSIDITLSGLYKYAESSDFDILLFSVSIDDGDVVTYDLASGEQLPDEIIRAMTDTAIAKRAFHVNFERVCISVYLRRNYPDLLENRIGSYLPPEGWYCDMVQVRYFGLPSSLKEVATQKQTKKLRKERDEVVRERDELKAKLSAVSSELATYKKKEEDARYFSREKMKKEATRISREDELSRELKKAKAFISACGLSVDYQQFRYNNTTRKNVLE